MNMGGFPGNYPSQMGAGFYPPFPIQNFPSLLDNQHKFHPVLIITMKRVITNEISIIILHNNNPIE
jgi:hypothetical protein